MADPGSHIREQDESMGMVVMGRFEGLLVCGIAGMQKQLNPVITFPMSPSCFHTAFPNIFSSESKHIISIYHLKNRSWEELRVNNHFSWGILSNISGWKNIYQVTWAYIFFLIKDISSFLDSTNFQQKSTMYMDVVIRFFHVKFFYLIPWIWLFTLIPGSFHMPTKFITAHRKVDINWLQALKWIFTIDKKNDSVMMSTEKWKFMHLKHLHSQKSLVL